MFSINRFALAVAMLCALNAGAETLIDQSFVTETSSTTAPTGWTERQFKTAATVFFNYGTNGALVRNAWQMEALDTAVTLDPTVTNIIDVVTYATTKNVSSIVYLSSSDFSVCIGNSYDSNDDICIGEINRAATSSFCSFQSNSTISESELPINQKTIATAEEGFNVGTNLTYHLILFGTSLTGTVSDGTTTATISYTLSKNATFDRVGIALDGEAGSVGVQSIKVTAQQIVVPDDEKNGVIIVTTPANLEMMQAYADLRAQTITDKTFTVVTTNAVLAGYPIGSTGVRNLQESIHKYLRARRPQYVIIGASWADIPGVIAQVKYTAAGGTVYQGAPSDMFYGCLDIPSGQTYPWCVGTSTNYFEQANVSSYDYVADCAVSRIPLRPIEVNGVTNTVDELFTAFTNKIVRAESAAYTGAGRIGIVWDSVSSSPKLDGSLPDEHEFYDDTPNLYDPDRFFERYNDKEISQRQIVKDHIAAHWPVKAVDTLGDYAWTRGFDNVNDAAAHFYAADHDYMAGDSHGWKNSAGWLSSDRIKPATGLTLFVDLSVPCHCGMLDQDEPCLAENAVLAPNGGALSAVANTREGWANGNAGSYRLYHGSTRAFLEYNYDAGNTWKQAHLDLADKITSGADGYDAFALVENTLFGDPFVKTAALATETTFAAGAVTLPAGTNAYLNASCDGALTLSGDTRIKILQNLTVSGDLTVNDGVEGGVGGGIIFPSTGGTLTLNTTKRFYVGDVANCTALNVNGANAVIEADGCLGGYNGIVPTITFNMAEGATNILRGTGATLGSSTTITVNGGTLLLESPSTLNGCTVALANGARLVVGNDPTIGGLAVNTNALNATFTGTGTIEYPYGGVAPTIGEEYAGTITVIERAAAKHTNFPEATGSTDFDGDLGVSAVLGGSEIGFTEQLPIEDPDGTITISSSVCPKKGGYTPFYQGTSWSVLAMAKLGTTANGVLWDVGDNLYGYDNTKTLALISDGSETVSLVVSGVSWNSHTNILSATVSGAQTAYHSYMVTRKTDAAPYFSLYVDGELVATCDENISYGTWSGNYGGMQLGAVYQDYGSGLKTGTGIALDAFAYWSGTTLSSNEVAAITTLYPVIEAPVQPTIYSTTQRIYPAIGGDAENILVRGEGTILYVGHKDAGDTLNIANDSTITIESGAQVLFTYWGNNSIQGTAKIGDITINGEGTFGYEASKTHPPTYGNVTGTATLKINDGETNTVASITNPISIAGTGMLKVAADGTQPTSITVPEGYQLVTTTGSSYITYTIELIPTVTLVDLEIPEVTNASVASVTTNGVEVTAEGGVYKVLSGATVVVTFKPDEGYALDVATATLTDVSETNYKVDASAVVAEKLLYHWYKFNGNTDSSGEVAFTMGGNTPSSYVAGAKGEAKTAFEVANARIWGNNTGFSLGDDEWTISIVNTMPTKSNAVVFAAGSASWDPKTSIAIVSTGSEHPGVKVITGSTKTFTDLLSAEVTGATTKFRAYALTLSHPTQNATQYTLYVDGVEVASTISGAVTVGDEYQFGDIHGMDSSVTTYRAEDGIVDDFRVYHEALSADELAALTGRFLTVARYEVTLGEHANATVTGLPTEAVREDAAPISFTVAADEGCILKAVKANGTALTGTDGVYTYAVTSDTEITVDAAVYVPQMVYVTDGACTTFVDADGNTVTPTALDTIVLDDAHCTTTNIFDLTTMAGRTVLWMREAGTITAFPATTELEVTNVTTTITTSSCVIKGTLTIDADATLNAAATDQTDYNASTVVINVKGTLAMGSKRLSIGNHQLNVWAGATISGTGDGNGALDFFKTSTVQVYAAEGEDTVTWSANVRLRANETIDVPEGVTVNLSGNLLAEGTSYKTLTKTGAGTLSLSGSNVGHAVALSGGTLVSTTALTPTIPEGYRLLTTTSGTTYTYTLKWIYLDENGIEPFHWYTFDGNNTGCGFSNFVMTANAPTVYCAGATNGANNAFNFVEGTTNQRIYGNDSGFALGTNDWTIAIVGKLPSTENGALFCAGSASWDAKKAYEFLSTGSSSGIKVTRNDGAFTLAAEVADATTTFHAYALTYAKDAQTYTLYVDGVEMASIEGDYTFESDEYQFGSVHGGDGYKANDGAVDDFRVYHAALSADQLKLAAATFGFATRYELQSNESSYMTSRKIVKEYLTVDPVKLIIPNGVNKGSQPTLTDDVGTYWISSDGGGTYIEYVAKDLAPHTFQICNDGNFKLDGTNFLIRCAEMHFARIPRGYWRDRIRRAKACGFNAVCAYMFWNNHEPEKGYWRFDGEQDVHYFCQLAQEEGMWVVLRPGPYTCAEWEYGGFPWWFRKEGVSVRTNTELYMNYSQIYLNKVNEEIGDLQITRGGPILMVQVENEYGFFGSNATYMRACYNATVKAGFEVPKFCCAPKSVLTSGYIPELFPVINGGSGFFGSGGGFEALANLRKGTQWEGAPLMVGEYYPAWYDSWGNAHQVKDTATCVSDLTGFCTNNASFSVYMAHGGTSFGWGAGFNEATQAMTPSYDYNAPITEAGHYNEKFWAFKAVFDAHLNAFETAWPSNTVPEEIATQTATIPTTGAQYANFWDMPDETFTLVTNDTNALTFEKADLGYGYLLYETTIPAGLSGTMTATVKDLGVVRIDGKDVGYFDYRYKNYGVLVEASDKDRKLQIFTEAFGRSHFYLTRDVDNGIQSAVKIGDTTITNWTMKTFNIIEHKTALSNVVYSADVPATGRSASLYKYQVELESGKDTFLDMHDWKRGMVCLNGHWLGHYWSIGPQQDLYVPGCWLNESGTNEVIILDMIGVTPPAQLTFTDEHVIDELRASTDYMSATRLRPDVPDGYLTDENRVLSGTLQNVTAVQTNDFATAQTGRYLAVTVTSAYSDHYAACAEFGALDADGNAIDRTNWKVVAISSEEYVGETANAELMLDGDSSTFWHSEWKIGKSTLPQSFVIDMGATNTVSGFTWQARQNLSIVAKDFSAYVLMKGPFDTEESYVVTPSETGDIIPTTDTNLVKVVIAYTNAADEVSDLDLTSAFVMSNVTEGTTTGLRLYLNPAGYVMVPGEANPIAVMPELTDEDDTVVPLEIEEDAVAVGVKTIPGLTYHLDRYGTVADAGASSNSTDVDHKTAEDTRTQLKDATEKPDKAFYRVRVTK